MSGDGRGRHFLLQGGAARRGEARQGMSRVLPFTRQRDSPVRPVTWKSRRGEQFFLNPDNVVPERRRGSEGRNSSTAARAVSRGQGFKGAPLAPRRHEAVTTGWPMAAERR